MSFRLFGFPVEIQFWFWAVSVIFGLSGTQGPDLSPRDKFARMGIWVGVVFVSVLVHELGHAFAFRRHGIQSEITLHGMGGRTTPRVLLPLRRIDNIGISLAGPFAGFLLGGAVYLLVRFVPLLHASPTMGLLGLALRYLIYVNIVWGLVNLLPVLPLDGGHVLEQTLGPKRVRISASISFLVAGAIAMLAAMRREYYIAMLFGLFAIQNIERFRSGPEVMALPDAPRPARPREELSGDVVGILRRAREALADEQPAEALRLAAEVLERDPPAGNHAVRHALEVVAWARLLEDDVKAAAGALAQARRLGRVDPALLGAVHLALGELKQARQALEEARAAGDDRKEVVGPLVRVLLEQGEVTRAAATALDIVDSLSEDDARKIAEIAFEHGAFDWSARLYEAVFRRNGEGRDAYDAARASAKDGNLEQALELLRRAVEAGFTDRARAWSDAALESLRNGPLETVVPRP